MSTNRIVRVVLLQPRLSYKELGDMQSVTCDMDLAINLSPRLRRCLPQPRQRQGHVTGLSCLIADFTTALGYTPQDTNILVTGLSYHFSTGTPNACSDWRTAVQVDHAKRLESCGTNASRERKW